MDRTQSLPERGATGVRVGRLFDPVSESKALLWDGPGAGTMAWIAAHTTAAAVFVATALTASTHQWWLAVLAVLLVVMLSGLVGRVAFLVLLGDGDKEVRIESSLSIPFVTTPVRAALFLAAAYAALVLPLSASSTLVGACAGFIVVSIGARFAGLDAWEGALRPRWHYVRSVSSTPGMVAVIAFLALSGLVFVGLGSFTDLLGGRDSVATVLSGRTWTIRRQYVELMIVAFSPLIPTLAVCEIISAIARYDSNLRARVTFVERMNERIGVGDDIHDGPLQMLARLRVAVDDDPALSASVEQIQLELERLRFETSLSGGTVPLRECLRNALRISTRAGFQLEIDGLDPAMLATQLPPEPALLIERVVVTLTLNSIQAGATTGWLSFEAIDASVRVAFFDDGVKYDPVDALASGGALSNLERQLVAGGGSLDWSTDPSRTVTMALIA